ncbi:MAG: outer membrane beta-barrel protein [Xanthomonadales bacterium]|nr:outer membrane beta-barrel protein [Xanthomonadales bacterium]
MRYWILLLLFAAVPGQGQSLQPAPWYVGAHIGFSQVDDEFGASDDGAVFRGNLGRQVTDALTLELEVGGGEVDFDQGPSLDQTHIALNLMIVNRSVTWNPYFLAGFGGFDHDVPQFADTGPMAQVGIGGMWDLNGFGLMLRADLRYRHSDLDLELVDRGQTVLTIGLEFPFGRN